MFETFKKHFLPDSASTPTVLGVSEELSSDMAVLLAEFGGSSFNGGLYRVVRVSDLNLWVSRIVYAFPDFKERITCFGYDWLGRAFAVDQNRLEGGKPGVVMFEPGTGQVLKIPANIETFHDELVKFSEPALAMSSFRNWEDLTHVKLEYDQCAGYKKPLFLGGTDNLDDLEISDIDVYWHLFGQLIRKARGLPLGTAVRIGID